MKAVVEGKLYRGQRPQSFDQLKANKIVAIVNLQFGWHEIFNDDFYEKNSPWHNGFDYWRVECSDFFPPTPEQVNDVLSLIEMVDGPTFIHCRHGKDRTGFMCAVYRMQVQGWTFEQAKDELFAEGFHWFPYFFWLKELKKYEVKK